MKIIINGGAATAIETVCPAYETVPMLSGQLGELHKTMRPSEAVQLLAASTAAAAREYRLKEDREGFCERILADYGPDGDTPLVRRKR